MKKLIIIICIICAFVVGAFLFIIYRIPHVVMKELEQQYARGIIIKMEKSAPCFINVFIKQTADTIDFEVCHCSADTSFFSLAAIGDSIIKQKNSMRLIIKKNNLGETKDIAYPTCIE